MINTARLKKMLKDLIADNHRTTLMSIPEEKKLRKLEYNSVVVMRNSIMEASPLFIFAQMSIAGFFVSNEYVVKDKEFSNAESDILLTLLENIRHEFGNDFIWEIIDRKSLNESLADSVMKNKKLLAAYVFALNKDTIVIEAENVAVEYLRNTSGFHAQQN